jgi:hypothetical protein
VVLPKTAQFEQVTSTGIVNFVKAPAEVPLRVDFAGGWLDVPRHARPGSFVVNCAISPLVSLREWPFEHGGGLGGSAAYATLTGRDAVGSELDLGVGWQDPASIHETGLCAWRSGQRPVLEVKVNPEFLRGRLGLLWTGKDHYTPGLADRRRDYDLISQAGQRAREALEARSALILWEAVTLSHRAQLAGGMVPLPDIAGAVARKYCGGGWGGYAVYCFACGGDRDRSGLLRIEPFLR